MSTWGRVNLSKDTIQVIGLIAVICALVYFNARSCDKEGFDGSDKKILNYQQKEIIDNLKGKVCSKDILDEMKNKVKDLDKKLQQMKGMNNVNSGANDASSKIMG